MPWRLLWLLLGANFVLEFGVMALLSLLPVGLAVHGWVEAAVDSIVLSLLLFPILFYFLFRPLVRHIEQLERTETELRGLQEQLEQRVRQRTAELESRTRETTLLAEMSDYLQTCVDADEAYAIVTRTAQDLFPGTTGVLFVYSESRNDLVAQASWGAPALERSERAFAPDQCWAIRRGRTHRVDPPHVSGPNCWHGSAPPSGYVCVPMAAQGEVIGVIQLRHAAPPAGGAVSERLAVTLAEYVALALTNLRLRQTLRDQSIHDALTGLFNRRYMEETLEREIRRAQRGSDLLGIAMLDIDHFKRFNDSHGHQAGDELLREVGALLGSQVRGGDIACRYGGEEFLLILPGIALDAVHLRVEALRQAAGRLRLARVGEPVTISAGIAMFPSHGTEGADLVRAADQALYRAKAAGRDRVEIADPAETGS